MSVGVRAKEITSSAQWPLSDQYLHSSSLQTISRTTQLPTTPTHTPQHTSPSHKKSSYSFAMGNGAKAQQKRERAGGKNEKKGPTSQLKSVSRPNIRPEYMRGRSLTLAATELRCSNHQMQDLLYFFPEYDSAEGFG